MPQEFTEKEEKVLEKLPDEVEEYLRLEGERQRLERKAKILEIQREKNKRVIEHLEQASEKKQKQLDQ